MSHLNPARHPPPLLQTNRFDEAPLTPESQIVLSMKVFTNTIKTWIVGLPERNDKWFFKGHVTGQLFSANRVFEKVLDSPETFGFEKGRHL